MSSETFTIISVCINIILITLSVALAVVSWKDRQKKNDQVKIWMEEANGVSEALLRIIRDKWNNLYSSVSDITNAVNSVQASAFALYQSLYEERILSEKEVKQHHKKIRDLMDKQFGLDQQLAVSESTKSDKKTPKPTQ